LSVDDTLRDAFIYAYASGKRVIGIGFSTTFKLPYVRNSKVIFGKVFLVLFIKIPRASLISSVISKSPTAALPPLSYLKTIVSSG